MNEGSARAAIKRHFAAAGRDEAVATVGIMEFRHGKVFRETIYVGDPWDPPARRSQWVEPLT